MAKEVSRDMKEIFARFAEVESVLTVADFDDGHAAAAGWARNSQLSGAEGGMSGVVATSGERAHTKTARVSLDRGTVMSM